MKTTREELRSMWRDLEINIAEINTIVQEEKDYTIDDLRIFHKDYQEIKESFERLFLLTQSYICKKIKEES